MSKHFTFYLLLLGFATVKSLPRFLDYLLIAICDCSKFAAVCVLVGYCKLGKLLLIVIGLLES